MILDVRHTTEYVDWPIPGSLHIDTYEALKMHDPEALSEMELPGHSRQPVPFDGVPISTTLVLVDKQIELIHLTRADFVRQLLSKPLATSPNADRLVTLNEHGLLPEGSLTELEAGANRSVTS